MAAQEFLIDVRCPNCNQLWFRMLGVSIIEVKCFKCKRIWRVAPGMNSIVLTEKEPVATPIPLSCGKGRKSQDNLIGEGLLALLEAGASR